MVLPRNGASEAPRLKAQTTLDSVFQPAPYPNSISPGYATPHPHITVETVSTAHIPSLTRITGLLLPIRYPNSFYTATITDPVITSLSRVAIYHDHQVPAASPSTSLPGSANTGTDKVIGGIRCRLERLLQTTTELLHSQSQSQQEPSNLYIQTLHLLSPYRGHGVAASLLHSLLFASPPAPGAKVEGYAVSALVKHYNIRTVTAHVHEANDEALQWYRARGFQIEDGVVENYYRRLKPSGAKIVKLVLKRDDPAEDASAAGPTGHHGGEEGQADDDGWEQVDAEDAVEHDHGVQPLSGSRELDSDDSGGSRKRKAEDQLQ